MTFDDGAPVFSDLNAACKALLLTSVSCLNSTGVRFVVAGGWVPVLYVPDHPTLVHPGTRDVDILLLDEDCRAALAAEALLEASFRPSAKHEFQLLRNARVGQREFVFNVDLMHPSEASETSEMFHDLFDLNVSTRLDVTESRFVKSIMLPSSSVIDEQSLYATLPIKGTDLDGLDVSKDVPIISPTGSILSKCTSVALPKRTRDAFDIFYLLTSDNGIEYAKELRSLASAFPTLGEQLDKLTCFLRTSSDKFDRNVGKHSARPSQGSADQILGMLA